MTKMEQLTEVQNKLQDEMESLKVQYENDIEIQNIITPLATDCLKEEGQSWYYDVEPDMEKKDDDR